MGVDLFAITLASLLAFIGRDMLGNEPTGDLTDNVMPVAGVLIVLWMALLAMLGNYHWRRLGAGTSELNGVLSASLLTAGLAGVTAYLADYPLSRGYFVLVFVLGTVLLLLGRMVTRQIVRRLRERGSLRSSALLVGDVTHVENLAVVLRRTRWLGYDIEGVLTAGAQANRTPSGLPIMGDVDEVAEIVRSSGVELVIFTEGAFCRSQQFNQLARDLEDHHAQLVVVPALTDVSAARMNLRPVAGLPLVFIESPRAARATRWAKRLFDIVGSSIALLLALPVMLVIALAIHLEDGGPIIFRQTRSGLKGRPFECLKFRSMVVDAEAKLRALRRADQSARVLFKMKEDPRITRVGRITRRLSLDELPQLFNVLRGQMSLIGPRPALPSEVAKYAEHVHRRLDVRPGLTGLWQVSGRSDLSWEETVRLDLYYVDNWSLLQDLSILRRTLGAVISARGAY